MNQMESDHDILIEMRSDLKSLGSKVDVINDGAKQTDDDHEKRIRFIERYGFMAVGGLYVIMVLIGWYLLFRKQ